jgi:lysophospholipase L1-like esterase
LVILGSCFLFAKSASAATYYVNASAGSDSNGGTNNTSDAWLTLEHSLTGNRVHLGDTIELSGILTPTAGITVAVAAGSGPVTIHGGTINIPAALANYLIYSSYSITFSAVNFTNTNSAAGQWLWPESSATFIIQDSTLDHNETSTGNNAFILRNTFSGSLTFQRNTITNIGRLVYFGGTVSATSTVNIRSNYISEVYRVIELNDTANKIIINITNNTIEKIRSYGIGIPTADQYVIKNNIFITSQPGYSKRAIWLLSTGETYVFNNPTALVLKNNVFWADTIADNTSYDEVVYAANYQIPVDISNWFVNPLLDPTTHAIGAGSYAAGKGDITALPATDLLGNAWSGADVGAVSNPATTGLSLTSNKAAFVGDSIMRGLTGPTAGNEVWTVFGNLTGLSVVTGANASIGSLHIEGARFLVDKVLTEQSPSTIFLAVGINNTYNTFPANTTNQGFADTIDTQILAKIADRGATPIWLGVGSHGGATPVETKPLAVNATVGTYAALNSINYDSWLDRMMLRGDYRNYYYGDTGVHPNNAGHLLIAQLARYLYYPRHTIGTDVIDITTGARIYNDGKFRDGTSTNLAVVGSNKATLSVTPSGGIGAYNTNDFSDYMDISINNWNTSDTYSKQWTASSSVATTTIYTVGNLQPNTLYNIYYTHGGPQTLLDSQTSNGSGVIVFTYNAGYSSVTFDITQGNTAPSVTFDNDFSTWGSGLVTVNYNLIDDQADTVNISQTGSSGIEYSTDGSTWYDATKGTGGDALTGLTSTVSPGIDHSFVWNSTTDLPTTEDSTVYVRIRPNDGITSATDWVTSNAFGVDNVAPSSVGVATFGTIATSSIQIIKPATVTENGSGLYQWQARRNSATELGYIATSTTSLTDSDLLPNTQYTYDVKFKDNQNNISSYGTQASKYTLVDTPTNLSASLNSNNITLTVDSFSNDTSGSSGYYFSRSGANSDWIQANSWTDSGLSCGNSYTYSVIYRNGDGTETTEISTTKSTSGCGGGGGSPAMWTLPTVPLGGFKININNGALTTSNRNVFLNFNAGADIKKVAISMTGDFTDASQEDYVASKHWDLCSKLGGAIKTPTCPDGTYKVYVQFYTAYGRTTSNALTSSTISLKSSTTSTENLQQYTNLPFINPFTKYLQYKQTNADIKRLQIFLNSDPDTKIADTGAGSPGKETNYFGLLTKKAVIKFQEKYTKDILTPWGFAKGTGYVGKTTLAKINELMGNK